MTARPDGPGPGDERADVEGAAQVAVGILAARARGDDAGIQELLAAAPDPDARAVGFLMVAELSVTLLAQALDCSREEVCSRISVSVAAGLSGE